MDANWKDMLKRIPWYLIAVGLLGLFLLLWGSFPRKKTVSVAPEINLPRPQICEEEKLLELLSLVGIGNIKVMISYSDQGIKYLATDENIETVYENGKVVQQKEDKKVVRLRDAAGESAYVLHEKTPQVSGVCITSSKPVSTAQKLKIIEAVRALWDLPLGRIVVLGKD